MTDATLPAVSRSLWQDAWLRLRKNRAAVASAVVLALLALVGIFGPMLSPHSHSTIYQQYVRVAPSLEAYPKADDILPGFEREMKRARLTGDEPVLDGSRLSVALTAGEKPIAASKPSPAHLHFRHRTMKRSYVPVDGPCHPVFNVRSPTPEV